MLKENWLPLIKMITTNIKHWKTANLFFLFTFLIKYNLYKRIIQSTQIFFFFDDFLLC